MAERHGAASSDDDASKGWTLSVLGGFAVTHKGGNVLPPGRKSRALLAYVLLCGATATRRERLAALFWEDRGRDQARASLRQAIAELQGVAGGPRPLLLVSRDEIGACLEHLTIDSDRLRAIAEAGDLARMDAALANWTGPILDGLDGVGAAFDEWLAALRQVTEVRLTNAVLEAAERNLSEETTGLVSMIATRLLVIDPFNERALRLGLRAKALAGDTPEIHRLYRMFEARLRDELATVPSERTQRLVSELTAARAEGNDAARPQANDRDPADARVDVPLMERSDLAPTPKGWSAPWPHAPQLRWIAAAILFSSLTLAAGWVAIQHGASPRPSAVRVVAVLPWAVTTTDPSTRALSERIAAVTRTDLPTERLAVRVAEAGDASLVRARRLGAQWAVSGDILTQPHATTITSRIQTVDGVLLWADRVQADPDKLVQAGDQVAHRTAGVLLCAVSGPRGVQRNDDTMARLMDVCGRTYASSQNQSDEATISAARQLAAAAPNDAYSHGILAAALELTSADLPPNLAANARVDAETQARRALQLDPRTGEAYLALGHLAFDRGDLAQAERLYLRGLAVEPDHPSLPDHLADLLKTVGRNSEALVFARRALALDPASATKVNDVADMLARTERPRAAFALLDQAEAERQPCTCFTLERVTLMLRGGDPGGARALLERTAGTPAGLEPPLQQRLVRQAAAIADPHGPIARAMVAELALNADASRASSTRSVLALISLGRIDAALDIASRYPIEPEVLFRQNAKALLLNPRFPDVARRQGLWTYWTNTAHWPDICREPGLPWRCIIAEARGPAPG